MGRFEKWGGWGVALVVGLIAYGWTNSTQQELDRYQVIADKLEDERKAGVLTMGSLTGKLREAEKELEKVREQLAASTGGEDTAGEAEEGEGGDEVAAMMKSLDTDGDGKIQESEAPDQMKQFFGMMSAAFDGFRMDVEDLYADGDTAIARLTIRGTHSGDTDINLDGRVNAVDLQLVVNAALKR